MRYFFVFLFFLTILSCNKNELTEVTILKYDYSKCLCCGGLIVQIEDKTYQCFNYPPSLSPDNKNDYPFAAKINFIKYNTELDKPCFTMDGLIDISEVAF